MAVIKFEVVNIIKEWDGEMCELEAKVISNHENLFLPLTLFCAKQEMKTGEEFQTFSGKIMHKSEYYSRYSSTKPTVSPSDLIEQNGEIFKIVKVVNGFGYKRNNLGNKLTKLRGEYTKWQ